MDSEVLTESVDRHPLVSLVAACFWVILWLLSWTKSLVAFATITIPRFIYAVLSYSMTLTLNFWNFAVLFSCSALALNYWIRFKYLNDYAQLKEPPLEKPDVNELHPDVNTDPPPTFHNYLDDFLQAVRVFGFLEKPVFHELARHLQTRRLIAGDSLSLDQDKSFYCVVEGTVQVFAQTDHSPEVQQSVWDDEDLNGYQLLNEVGSGGTLSSLFTILSLFTEDVQMSWQDDDSDLSTDNLAEFDEGNPIPPRNRSRRANSDVSPLRPERESSARRSSYSSTASTVHARGVKSPSRDGSISPNQDVPNISTPMPHSRHHHHPSRRLTQVRRGVVARATVDTTLAVIPAEAFRRLTKKFPKATGHIVQVILTRFTRVTFNAAHKYLGLTSEVLRTEKAINDIACHPLPTSFYEGGGLQYLRHRFDEANTNTSDSNGDYFSASPLDRLSPILEPNDPSTPSLGNLANKSTPIRGNKKRSQSRSSRSSRHLVQAGDLLVPKSVTNDPTRPLTRTFSVLNTPHVPYNFSGYDDGESPNQRRGTSRWLADDFDLREEVMSCIAKSIGLLQPPLSGSDSPPSPPRASTSAFGSLSLLDLGDDISSVTAGSSIHSSGNYLSGLDNEVEILFYAAGTTLAKAGESNTGLFYVIEGFLDILLPLKKSTQGKQPTQGQQPIPKSTTTPGAWRNDGTMEHDDGRAW